MLALIQFKTGRQFSPITRKGMEMKTPDKICLIDTGDGIDWCDSVPSNDIPDEAVVWYNIENHAASKVIEAAIETYKTHNYKPFTVDSWVTCHCTLCQAVTEYQKVTP